MDKIAWWGPQQFVDYSSSNTVMMKLVWQRGHVACMLIWEMCTEFWLESREGGDHSGNIDMDGKIILKLVLHTK